MGVSSLGVSSASVDPNLGSAREMPAGCTQQNANLRLTALAYDKNGTLYIAVQDLNRIFVLRRNRDIELLAGAPCSLGANSGGYVNGKASEARFQAPAGVAVGNRGELYIADSGNHVIRVYERGKVGTYGGSGESGNRDGTVKTAEFARPTGVSIDSDASLLVADSDSGLRKIAANGLVSTLPLLLNRPFAVAATNEKILPRLFIADNDGLVVYDISRQELTRFAAESSPCKGCQAFQGMRPGGLPFALAPLNNHSVFYTDSVTGEVHYTDVDYHITRIVVPKQIGAFGGIAFSRHSGNVAAVTSRGITLLHNLDTGKPFMPTLSSLLPQVTGANPQHTITYVGNSFVWWDTDSNDSIAGVLEKALNHKSKRGIRVLPIYIPDAKIQSAEQYISVLSDSGAMGTCVLQIDASLVSSSFSIPLVEVPLKAHLWQQDLISGIESLKRHLDAQHVTFIVVLHPEAFELSDTSIEQSIVPALRRSGVRVVDLYPIFRSFSAPDGLFGNPDQHFSARGRKLVGATVAGAIEKMLRGSQQHSVRHHAQIIDHGRVQVFHGAGVHG